MGAGAVPSASRATPSRSPLTSDTPGPLALIGSGEFLPQMEDLDRWLLSGRAPVVAVVPTAAAPEGDVSVQRWVQMARRHFAAIDPGIEVRPVLVRDTSDSLRGVYADAVEDAGLIYLSGGNPAHLSDTLRDSPVWHTMVRAWRGGAAIAGCSAGAMALAGSWPPFARIQEREFGVGLGLVAGLSIIPHFDRVRSWGHLDAVDVASRRPPGSRLVGLDEDTALVWESAGGWRVEGPGQVWELAGAEPAALPRGGLELPVPEVAAA